MPDDELDAIAAIMRWAKAHDDILLADTRWIGGYPGKQEVYGYSHFDAKGYGIIGLRNPALWPQKAKVTFDASLGRLPKDPFGLRVVYPRRQGETRLFQVRDTWEIELQGHELLVAEVEKGTTASALNLERLMRPQASARDVKSEATSQERTLEFVASVHGGVKAMLAVLVEGMTGQTQQEAVGGQLTVNGQEVKLVRHGNSRGHRFNYNTPWVLLRGDVPSGESRVRCRIFGVSATAGDGKLIALSRGGSVKDLSLSAWLLLEAAAPKQKSDLPVLPLRSSVEVVARVPPTDARPSAAHANAEICAFKPGSLLYPDRAFTVVSMPKELEGLEAIRFAHSPAKDNSELRFIAKRPVRVYVVFGPRDATDQWLDPQPGWDVYKGGEFKGSHPYIQSTIYCRDFPAGDVTLFSGQRGNYVLLGVAEAPAAK